MSKIQPGDTVYLPCIGYAVLTSCHDNQYLDYKGQTQHLQQCPYEALEWLFYAEQPQPPPPKQAPFLVGLQLQSSTYQVSTMSNLLKKHITTCVKVFFGNRSVCRLTVEISSTIQQLKQQVFKSLNKDISLFHKICLYHPLGVLKQLPDLSTVTQEKLPDNCKLVLLAREIFAMDLCKSSILIAKGMTFSKPGGQAYNSILANVGFNGAGKYYWEVKIQNAYNGDDVLLGVAYKKINLESCPTHCNYWGMLPLLSKKFSPDSVGTLVDYGLEAKVGDKIGVLIHFVSKLANLTFYKNGISYGLAYQGIKGTLYPAVTLFGTGNSPVEVSIDPLAPLPYTN